MEEKNLLKENIISSLGLEELSEERKVVLIDNFSELAEKRILLRIMQELPKEAYDEFEKVAEAGEDKKMEFLRLKISNLDEIIQEEILKVKKELIGEGEKIEEVISEKTEE